MDTQKKTALIMVKENYNKIIKMRTRRGRRGGRKSSMLKII